MQFSTNGDYWPKVFFTRSYCLFEKIIILCKHESDSVRLCFSMQLWSWRLTWWWHLWAGLQRWSDVWSLSLQSECWGPSMRHLQEWLLGLWWKQSRGLQAYVFIELLIYQYTLSSLFFFVAHDKLFFSKVGISYLSQYAGADLLFMEPYALRNKGGGGQELKGQKILLGNFWCYFIYVWILALWIREYFISFQFSLLSGSYQSSFSVHYKPYNKALQPYSQSKS